MRKEEKQKAPKISAAGLFGRALLMGTADIIPGISGGSIALITGIYPNLIHAIKSLGTAQALALWKLLFSFSSPAKTQKHLSTLRKTDWSFLLVLASGIALALLVMTRIIPYLLEHYAYYAYSFFTGLILVSSLIPLRQMDKAWPEFLLLALCLGLFFVLYSLPGPAAGNANLYFVFLSGALAICVMILPGISGSFVLLLLGQYKLIVEAARDFEFRILSVFFLGAFLGLALFVRLLHFLLERFFSFTMAVLTGMMLGSLRGIWPLRFADNTMSASELWAGGLAAAVTGMLLVWLTESLASNHSLKKNYR